MKGRRKRANKRSKARVTVKPSFLKILMHWSDVCTSDVSDVHKYVCMHKWTTYILHRYAV